MIYVIDIVSVRRNFNGEKIMHTKFWFLLLCVVLISAVLIGWLVPQAQAIRDGENVFGLTTLNAGQTLRLNAVNAGNGRGAVRVTMRFDIYSLGGPDTINGSVCTGASVAACTNNLRPIRRESCTISLESAGAATCDITAREPNTFVNTALLIEQSEPDSQTTILPSLEVRENNRTVYVHPGVIRGFNPQPDSPQN
jgi:hypothetical protein